MAAVLQWHVATCGHMPSHRIRVPEASRVLWWPTLLGNDRSSSGTAPIYDMVPAHTMPCLKRNLLDPCLEPVQLDWPGLCKMVC